MIKPTLHVIAGPNGCGKSTMIRMSGFRGLEIFDPDAIACSITSGNPAHAAREALRRRRAALGAGRSHLVETTLAGVGILRHMAVAQTVGYWIVLHFVPVGSPDQALDRIRNRVARGGQNSPDVDARRRFARSHANRPFAIARSDVAMLYDNTDLDRPHREVAILRDGTWWIAEGFPEWLSTALARAGPPHRR